MRHYAAPAMLQAVAHRSRASPARPGDHRHASSSTVLRTTARTAVVAGTASAVIAASRHQRDEHEAGNDEGGLTDEEFARQYRALFGRVTADCRWRRTEVSSRVGP